MAYDPTNPAHLAAVVTYVTLTKGLDAFLTPTVDILNALNDPAENPGAEVGAAPLTAQRLVEAIFDSNVSSQDQFRIGQIVEISQALDDDLSDFRPRVVALGGQLATAVNAQTRPLSWAEAQFGAPDANGVWEQFTMSNQDWFAARDTI